MRACFERFRENIIIGLVAQFEVRHGRSFVLANTTTHAKATNMARERERKALPSREFIGWPHGARLMVKPS